MTSSNPNYFPKAPPPNSITGGGGREGAWARALTYEFGEDIQSITPLQKHTQGRMILVSPRQTNIQYISDKRFQYTFSKHKE